MVNPGALESDTEKFGSETASASLVIGYFMKRAKIIRRIAEVGVPVASGDFQHRPYRRQKRGLSGAVFADQQRQRRQARRLLLSKAAEVA